MHVFLVGALRNRDATFAADLETRRAYGMDLVGLGFRV